LTLALSIFDIASDYPAIFCLFTKYHHNDDLRNSPATSVIPLRIQRRNRITKIAGVANTSSDISSMPRFPATSPDSAVSLSRVEWSRAVPNMYGKYKYYSVCYMFETSISDACPSSSTLRTLAEHIRRHCSYGNAGQDLWDRGCM
jgi:hypothetical protein